MRKLEGVVKEITDEMNYLQRREERMRDTNGEFSVDVAQELYSLFLDADLERITYCQNQPTLEFRISHSSRSSC